MPVQIGLFQIGGRLIEKRVRSANVQHQESTVRRNIEQGKAPRKVSNQPLAPRAIYGVQRSREAILRGSEQDLIAGRIPREPVDEPQPKLRERLFVALCVHCSYGSNAAITGRFDREV